MSHFNREAAQWDSEGKIKLMQTLASKTIEGLNLTGELDILDFGCGTGLFGLEFAEHTRSLVGIDTSEGMLQVFDRKTEGDQRFSSHLVNLEDEDFSGEFDLIVSSMAFHHLEHPEKMIKKLKGLLRSDGKMVIVDLDQEDGSFHPDNKGMGVKHFGFAKETLEEWAQSAGLHLKWEIINKIEKEGREYAQFMAVFLSP
jgi:2-polyprenyl-3-methyl-5-hydroxy-6-metoxy-1,4-benzoquinol methylase